MGAKEPQMWVSHRLEPSWVSAPLLKASVSNSVPWGWSSRLMGELQLCTQQALHRCMRGGPGSGWDPARPSGNSTAGQARASH